MKKIVSLIIVTISALSVVISCKSGSAGEAYTLKMRLAPGDNFKQELNMNMDMKMAGFNMKMIMEAETSFEVLAADTSGKQMRLTYTKMKMKMDMGELNKAVSSDSMMNESQQKIVGKSVTLTLSPENEIIKVSGFDSLMNNDLYDPVTKQLFEKTFSKEQLNSMFGMMFSMYPSKPVRIGNSWSAKSKFNMANIDMGVNTKYKLIAVKDSIAEIDVDGKMDGDGNMKQENINVGMSMKGTQKGRMQIKISDGYLHSGSYKMDASAEVEMMGQKIPITMIADYEMTGK
ncbi:MAG: hypothetical protein IPH18_15485 [Chitinophagaceae bacterium]|nr:hypothetical protein [Chitinophagaceae bacterium]